MYQSQVAGSRQQVEERELDCRSRTECLGSDAPVVRNSDVGQRRLLHARKVEDRAVLHSAIAHEDTGRGADRVPAIDVYCATRRDQGRVVEEVASVDGDVHSSSGVDSASLRGSVERHLQERREERATRGVDGIAMAKARERSVHRSSRQRGGPVIHRTFVTAR